MDDQDSPRAWRDGALNCDRIEIQRDGINLDENRRCANLQHGIDQGNK